MKKVIKKIMPLPTLDTIKAMRRSGRVAEQELLGPGFHSFNRLHRSKNLYAKDETQKRLEKII